MKPFSLILLLLSLSGSILLGILYIKQQKLIPKEKQQAYIDHLLQTHVCMQSLYSPLILKPGTNVKDEYNRSFSLDSIITSTPGEKLVFRFTENNCIDCIKAELLHLEKIAPVIGKDNIILLASYTGTNDLKLFRKAYNPPFSIYNTPLESLAGNQLEDANLPYYFVLNKDLSPHLLFIPEKTLAELTEQYYKMMTDYVTHKALFSDQKLAANETTIFFPDTTHNLNQLKPGRHIETKFPFRNTGNAPLLIKLVKPDCGCTIAEYPRYAIKPGDSASIDITYTTGETGYFSRQIKVYSNSIKSPAVLKLYGKVYDN